MKITIESNIGGGKSTLLSLISQRTRLPIFLEPVDTDWKQGLNLFYQDQTRWGFTFNLNVLNTYHQWKDNQFKAVYERSPLSCYNVFTQLQYESHQLTDYEFELFQKFYKALAWKPDVIIYLRTLPKICLQRMQLRARACEKEVPLSYLEAVHDKYETMIKSFYLSNEIPVFIIDGNRSKEFVYEDVMKIIESYQSS